MKNRGLWSDREANTRATVNAMVQRGELPAGTTVRMQRDIPPVLRAIGGVLGTCDPLPNMGPVDDRALLREIRRVRNAASDRELWVGVE